MKIGPNLADEHSHSLAIRQLRNYNCKFFPFALLLVLKTRKMQLIAFLNLNNLKNLKKEFLQTLRIFPALSSV